MRSTTTTADAAGELEGRVASVGVAAPARLHLGFLDLAGTLGRRFGSLGMTLEAPQTRVRIARAPALAASGPDSERAAAAARKVAAALDIALDVAITVEGALPPHAGLGSGTQLGLAVGCGLAALAGRRVTPREIARILERGARSSIGLAAFEAGGIVLDGGRGPDLEPPPVIARLEVPEDWRILLISDRSRHGLSGEAEKTAMATLPPFPEELAGRLCRLAVMAALPAAASGDARGFGQAVSEIQRRLGDHYAAAQGGRFTSPDVGDILAFLEREGAPGVGQSSWGPTGFAILGDPEKAQALTLAARARLHGRAGLTVDCMRGNNRGASILASATHSAGGPVER